MGKLPSPCYFRIVVVLLSVIFGFTIVRDAIETWVMEPIGIVVEDHHYKASEKMEFPTVTVCPVQDLHPMNLPALILNRFN